MPDTAAPQWVDDLKQAYLSGAASMFILHGNTSDLVGSEQGGEYNLDPLSDYLAQHLFGSYDIVLHFDLGRGLRALPGRDQQRLARMNADISKVLGDKGDLPRDPTQAMRVIDRLASLLIVGAESRTRKTAVLFDYADMICPPDGRTDEHLATFLNWARSPVIRRVNLIFILMTESLGLLHPALVQSGHTYELLVPMPNEAERRAFIAKRFPQSASDADRLAILSSGLTLTNLDTMMRRVAQSESAPIPASAAAADVVKPDTALQGPAPIKTQATSDSRMLEIKKSLMEAQCPGLFEFIKPNFTLDLVAGHTAAKDRLTSDARLIREGKLDAVPMGYLLCGPVGVGKTFLALCYAGEVGIPCLSIRNFRSKYVGETEANLERILSVVRELGPVAVIIDEADAAVGDRSNSGDSGTSSRVFAQLASQMGDTRYRGKIIWFLLTCRPDLLPIDLKRQGRCEEHIPLFYPQTPDELKDMFRAMSKKAKVALDDATLDEIGKMPPLSGADIEGILMRARRESILSGKPVDANIIKEVMKSFRSVKGPEHELQWIAGILECTDTRYLPADVRKATEKEGGFEVFAKRFRELSALEQAGM
ncbi:MAG: ATPase AAA [Candidatus Hydrogenedentota bacterium]